MFVTACAAGEDSATDDNVEYPDEDFQVDPEDGKGDGVAAVFDRNDALTDVLFEQSTAMTAQELQAFFEDSPYHNKSWLATYTTDSGKSASEAIVDTALAFNIHPLVLVGRMQVETSLVSKTTRPTQRMIDRATGCGCPDGGGCASQYKGFDKQLECSATILRKWFDKSADGTGIVVKDEAYRTLDPLTVTPRGNATASLYAYTPWVLVNRGGNWLVWNVTRKYVRHAETMGWVDP